MTFDEIHGEATLSSGRVLRLEIETLAPAGQNLCVELAQIAESLFVEVGSDR
jgi:hypothetical protein